MHKRVASLVAALVTLLSIVSVGESTYGGDAAAPVAPPTCGDVNQNGQFSPSDALRILKASVGTPFYDCEGCVCDVNNSGSVTPLDALVVLRVSVGIATNMTCPACKNAHFHITSKTICTATHVTIPASALPEGLSRKDCELWPGADDFPCEGSLEIDSEGLVVDVRRSEHAGFETCLLNGILFACAVTDEQADTMSAAANVACPCNCLPVCPSFALCNDDGGCSEPVVSTTTLPVASTSTLPVASASPLPVVTTSSTTYPPQPSSTSTTFCGTCCYMEELGQVEVVQAPQVFTEVLARVPGETTEFGCLFCDSGSFPSSRNAYVNHEDEDSSLVCIIDHHGIENPGVVASCEGYGFLQAGSAEVLRGSGINFEPLSALPSVKINAP